MLDCQMLFSRKDAAEILDISIRTLDRLISTDEIKVRRIGKFPKIHRDELDRFARGGSTSPTDQRTEMTNDRDAS